MRSVTLFLLVLLLVGCSPDAEDQMDLRGTIRGLKKGTLFLEREGDSTLVVTDSVVMDGDENFAFKVVLDQPELFYLRLRLNTGEPINERLRFFGEPGRVEVRTSLKRFGNYVRVTGSTNHKKLEAYQELIKRYTDRNLELIREQLEAGQAGNDSLVAAKRREQQKLLASKYLATVNFAVNEKDYEIAPYLMLTEIYNANIKYLDTVYNSLPVKIQRSRYGKALGELIAARRKAGN